MTYLLYGCISLFFLLFFPPCSSLSNLCFQVLLKVDRSGMSTEISVACLMPHKHTQKHCQSETSEFPECWRNNSRTNISGIRSRQSIILTLTSNLKYISAILCTRNAVSPKKVSTGTDQCIFHISRGKKTKALRIDSVQLDRLYVSGSRFD